MIGLKIQNLILTKMTFIKSIALIILVPLSAVSFGQTIDELVKKAESRKKISELEINNNTAQLKRFKDVVSVVEQGSDCGLVLNKFKGWKEGDVVHCFRVEYETKRLQLASPAS